MKPKNVMLLGFVNRAVEYLDKHMDEEPNARLAELKNIDLASLKDKLSDNLDASLGTMESTMSTLLKAGNEAFDKFIEDNHGKESVSEELDKLFDVDFNDDRKNNQKQLAKLLSFYNLESDNEIDDELVDDYYFDNDEQVYEDSEQFDDEHDLYLEEIKKNATNDDVQEIVPIEHNDSDEAIDSIFSEIVENETNEYILDSEDVKEDKEDIETVEDSSDENNEKLEQENGETPETYVSSLIDDLREQLVKEEEEKQRLEIKNKDIYDRISELYPYLPQGFIRSVYELKESLAFDYPLDTNVIVLHRVSFKDVENLRNFVEIGLSHDYTINADEKKMIVDIFKEFINTDGKILTNIYEIANQGYLLQGIYEGYNVIPKK